MNEIGDDFYATIKLRSGEEIFSKVLHHVKKMIELC